jgi:hypothetical protein
MDTVALFEYYYIYMLISVNHSLSHAALLAFIVVIKHIESKHCPFYVNEEQIDIQRNSAYKTQAQMWLLLYSSLFQNYVSHHRFIRP